jgi:hypothetical protein
MPKIKNSPVLGEFLAVDDDEIVMVDENGLSGGLTVYRTWEIEALRQLPKEGRDEFLRTYDRLKRRLRHHLFREETT